MALINPPAWLQQGSYPAKTDRQVIESIVPTEGVVSGFAVTQTPTASMSVNISAGKAFVAGTSVALQGMYNVINDAPSSVSISGSNTSNPRYDLIVITVNDADVSGTANSAEFRVIAGVPSSNPQVPSIPPSTLVLARVYVGANVPTITTSVITDVRIYTAATGGMIAVPDQATRLRLPQPAAGVTQLVTEQSSGLLWRRQGTTWSPITGETYRCTSSTRPSGVPAGFKIWETDTQQERVSNGSAWVWSGGFKPSGSFTLPANQRDLSTDLANPTALLLSTDFVRGGVTAHPSNGYRYIRVGESGIYRITLHAKISFATGMPDGAGAVTASFAFYNESMGFLGRRDMARLYPPGSVNWLEGSMSAQSLTFLSAGQAILPAFARVGGQSDWAVIAGTDTMVSIEYVTA